MIFRCQVVYFLYNNCCYMEKFCKLQWSRAITVSACTVSCLIYCAFQVVEFSHTKNIRKDTCWSFKSKLVFWNRVVCWYVCLINQVIRIHCNKAVLVTLVRCFQHCGTVDRTAVLVVYSTLERLWILKFSVFSVDCCLYFTIISPLCLQV